MKSLYNYQENINIVTTPNGDAVITMNKEILTRIRVAIIKAIEYCKAEGLEATADDYDSLFESLKLD